ncbi:hypothetical protein I4U23_019389 [Adineta vaga]|nr:hypothetical protein I4U23_019389 [Adineta vaga]
MGSCYSTSKSSRETFIQNENLEIFTLIWLDTTTKKSRKTNFIQQQLRTTINYLKIFTNEKECEFYIKQIPKDEDIIFIVNDQIGQTIISHIHDLSQLFSVYIYSPNKTTDQQWMNEFHKIRSICTTYNELINEINIDQTRCKYRKDELLFDIFRIDRTNTNNKRFLSSQILIDVLLEMDPMPNDSTDLLSLCRNQYKGNQFELQVLRKFDHNYSPDNVIWWFTKETFISQIFNKALRRNNIDLIFLFRPFLRDIQHQLMLNQYSLPIKVYKHQLINEQELELLKNSIGQFISIKNFLVTNIDRQLELLSTKVSLIPNNFQSILFEITADSNLNRIKPFAIIPAQDSSQKDSTEVLFMLGSIFELNNIHQDENNVWIIEMTLTNKTNKYLKSVLNSYKNDNEEINLLSFGCILQELKNSDEAEKYYRRLIAELSDEDERIAYCYLNLGNIAFIKSDYEASYEWLSKALEISLRTLESDDMFFALVYNSMGHMYNAKDDSKSAIESYKNAILIWKQSVDENYFNIAECTNNIGIVYKQEKDYKNALECFKKTLTILEEYLTSDHIDMIKTRCNIANVYRQLEEYDSALEHYSVALKISEKYYLTNSLELAKVMGNIGIIHALKNERQKALFYYEKTAEIYRQMLPPTHVNNIKIEQLIRDVSSSSRKISFAVFESK